MAMKGILQNESESPSAAVFSRDAVKENTRINSQLGSEGVNLKQKLASKAGSDGAPGSGKKYPKTKAPSALSFNQDELEEHDSQRGQTEKITEPNTPYMGTAENTEYYDDEVDELDLGEAEA